MPKNKKFFNTAGVVNPENHYFLPHRLDWKQLTKFIEKNTISSFTLLDKVVKQQRLSSL